VKKADAILIGHGHHDHMSDAATVGAQTGATVVGAPVTTEKLATQPIDPKQVRTVTGRGGESLQFAGFTVEPILARHGEPPASIVGPIDAALRQVTPPPTDRQTAEQAAIRQRGTSDRRVVAEGTIAYLITLDDGFRIMYRDSGGRITEQETAAMRRVGRVDLALVAVAATYLNTLTVEQALEHVRTTTRTSWSRRAPIASRCASTPSSTSSGAAERQRPRYVLRSSRRCTVPGHRASILP
jgi:L-ascorbate metabolism protein UlaG (beta-lactamase superfamily)